MSLDHGWRKWQPWKFMREVQGKDGMGDFQFVVYCNVTEQWHVVMSGHEEHGKGFATAEEAMAWGARKCKPWFVD
jgi:hypothetical protein